MLGEGDAVLAKESDCWRRRHGLLSGGNCEMEKLRNGKTKAEHFAILPFCNFCRH
jgi:hypothetical protein